MLPDFQPLQDQLKNLLLFFEGNDKAKERLIENWIRINFNKHVNEENKNILIEFLEYVVLSVTNKFVGSGLKSSANEEGYFKSDSQKEEDATALILKGGGVKGIAYLGALQELFKYNIINFDWFVGTSVGGMLSTLLGAGYKVEELIKIMYEKNFSDFLDSAGIWVPLSFLRKGYCYKGDSIRLWVDQLLQDKQPVPRGTEIKMSELQYRTSVFATKINKKHLLFDSEYVENYRNSPAAFAAKCSMSIPFLFRPELIEGFKVYDGGLTFNFPIQHVLNSKCENFLGLYLGQYQVGPIGNNKGPRLLQILKEIIEIQFNRGDRQIIEDHKERIIIINTSPIPYFKFNLARSEKSYLIDCGRYAALRFISQNTDILSNQDQHLIKDLAHRLKKRKRILKMKTMMWYIGLMLKFLLLTLINVALLIAVIALLIILLKPGFEEF